MREMLFRGKPKDQENFYFFSQCWKENCKDGFIYGSLVVDKDRCFIVVTALCSNRSVINNGITSMIEVIPETVGQFTGMIDKNGKKIFEGDFVRTENYIGNVVYDEFFAKFKVIYSKFSGNWFDFEGEGGYPIFLDCEVIGNIHDNPELWEV